MKRLLIAIVVGAIVSSCVPSETAAAGRSLLPPGSSIRVARGAGWTPSGLEGPSDPPGTCHYRDSRGYDLPDPACTPGSIDPSVTSANIDQTICRSGGYTSSVRPPETLTEPAKQASMAAYSDPLPTSRTELDHLIPLSLGGSSDLANLWAQPDQGSPAAFSPDDPYGINAKDGVEDVLHQAVCHGRVPLAATREAIASNWTTALARLGLP